MSRCTGNFADVIGNWKVFLDRAFQELARLKLDVQFYELDHICYRSSSFSEYEALKVRLLDFAQLLVESQVGGRPIATFRLYEPLQIKQRKIYLIELPAPKEGSPYPSGLEHIEFAVGEDFPNFAASYPHITFDKSQMKKAVNPELRLECKGMTIKFHQEPLFDVIKKEIENKGPST